MTTSVAKIVKDHMIANYKVGDTVTTGIVAKNLNFEYAHSISSFFYRCKMLGYLAEIKGRGNGGQGFITYRVEKLFHDIVIKDKAQTRAPSIKLIEYKPTQPESPQAVRAAPIATPPVPAKSLSEQLLEMALQVERLETENRMMRER